MKILDDFLFYYLALYYNYNKEQKKLLPIVIQSYNNKNSTNLSFENIVYYTEDLLLINRKTLFNNINANPEHSISSLYLICNKQDLVTLLLSEYSVNIKHDVVYDTLLSFVNTMSNKHISIVFPKEQDIKNINFLQHENYFISITTIFIYNFNKKTIPLDLLYSVYIQNQNIFSNNIILQNLQKKVNILTIYLIKKELINQPPNEQNKYKLKIDDSVINSIILENLLISEIKNMQLLDLWKNTTDKYKRFLYTIYSTSTNRDTFDNLINKSKGYYDSLLSIFISDVFTYKLELLAYDTYMNEKKSGLIQTIASIKNASNLRYTYIDYLIKLNPQDINNIIYINNDNSVQTKYSHRLTFDIISLFYNNNINIPKHILQFALDMDRYDDEHYDILLYHIKSWQTYSIRTQLFQNPNNKDIQIKTFCSLSVYYTQKAYNRYINLYQTIDSKFIETIEFFKKQVPNCLYTDKINKLKEDTQALFLKSNLTILSSDVIYYYKSISNNHNDSLLNTYIKCQEILRSIILDYNFHPKYIRYLYIKKIYPLSFLYTQNLDRIFKAVYTEDLYSQDTKICNATLDKLIELDNELSKIEIGVMATIFIALSSLIGCCAWYLSRKKQPIEIERDTGLKYDHLEDLTYLYS